MWGAIFVILCIVEFIASTIPRRGDDIGVSGYISLIFFLLLVFIGGIGNEMTAKKYLKLGWTFVEPDSEITKTAKTRWRISM